MTDRKRTKLAAAPEYGAPAQGPAPRLPAARSQAEQLGSVDGHPGIDTASYGDARASTELTATQIADNLERATRAAMPAPEPGDLAVQAKEDAAEDDPDNDADADRHGGDIVEQPLVILIESLRADAKVFISLRDDQQASWSEGEGRGLVGFSLSSTRDPTIYMRTFLINAREMYLQSYRACQELQCQLYVRTAQRSVRGRVDLPPGAVVTFQSGIDRTSVVGLSSFAVEFANPGARRG